MLSSPSRNSLNFSSNTIGRPIDTGLLLEQYDHLAGHSLSGIEHLMKLGEFMRQRSALEAEYASNLKTLVENFTSISSNNKTKSEPAGDEENKFSVVQAFKQLLSSTSVISDQHALISVTLDQEGSRCIQELSTSLSNERRQVLQEGRRHQANVSGKWAMVDQSWKAYQKTAAEATKAQVKFQQADADIKRSRSAVQKKQEILGIKTRACTEAQNAYLIERQEAVQLQHLYEDTLMPQILKDLREVELKRTAAYQGFLNVYIAAYRKVDPVISVCLTQVQEAGESIREDEVSRTAVERFKVAVEIARDTRGIETPMISSPDLIRSTSLVALHSPLGHTSSNVSRDNWSQAGTLTRPAQHRYTADANMRSAAAADDHDHDEAQQQVMSLRRSLSSPQTSQQFSPSAETRMAVKTLAASSTSAKNQQHMSSTPLSGKAVHFPGGLLPSGNNRRSIFGGPDDQTQRDEENSRDPSNVALSGARRKSLAIGFSTEELMQRIEQEQHAKAKLEYMKNRTAGADLSAAGCVLPAGIDNEIAECTRRLTELWAQFAQHAQNQSLQNELSHWQQQQHRRQVSPAAELPSAGAPAGPAAVSSMPLPPTPKTPKMGLSRRMDPCNNDQHTDLTPTVGSNVSVKDRIKWLNRANILNPARLFTHHKTTAGHERNKESSSAEAWYDSEGYFTVRDVVSTSCPSAGTPASTRPWQQQPEDGGSEIYHSVWSESIYATPGDDSATWDHANGNYANLPSASALFCKALEKVIEPGQSPSHAGSHKDDELSVVAGEDLEVLQPDNGKGWTRVRRKIRPSEAGFVPTRYIGLPLAPPESV